MHRPAVPFLAAAVLTLLAASAAVAQYVEPVRTANAVIPLVTAYQPCTSPNATYNVSTQACAPAVPVDSVCGFGPLGVGKVHVTTTRTVGGSEQAWTITGLNAGCEGQTLGLAAVKRVTANGAECSTAPCTAVDDSAAPLGGCTVTKGVCRVPAGSGFGPSGGTEILGLSVVRLTGPSLPSGPTFVMGILGR